MRIRVPGYDRSIARHEPHLENYLQDIQNDVRDPFWLCARVYCLQLECNALSYMEVAPTWFPDLKIFVSRKLVKRHFERQLPLLAPKNWAISTGSCLPSGTTANLHPTNPWNIPHLAILTAYSPREWY